MLNEAFDLRTRTHEASVIRTSLADYWPSKALSDLKGDSQLDKCRISNREPLREDCWI
jgi:hypothetical protein